MEILFREAGSGDVSRIVEMLADDALGSQRERFSEPLPESYTEAFRAIDADPNNELIVAVRDGRVIGVAQLTFTPYLTHQGAWRMTIEGVRTCSSVRGQGVGGKLIRYGIDRAKARGCRMVQLTTDKQRPDALRFYEGLGFTATHEGMKMKL